MSSDEMKNMGDQQGQSGSQLFMRQLTLGTGYVALGLLSFTLLIGPVNLLLRRRNPVSNYLRRDVGIWTAIFSVAHVIFGLQLHGTGKPSPILDYFLAPSGSPLTNSFGLGNWTGLAALVIVAGLLTLSSNFALRKLKAGPWKWLQRSNYALFALVILHAFFYGALLRVTSPFTFLLVGSVIAVLVGQIVGVWLWRRKYVRTTTG
jgi:sulfoxide reductase heme-binding subunit YedZ